MTGGNGTTSNSADARADGSSRTESPSRWRALRRALEIVVWILVLIWVGPRLLPQLFAVTGFGGTVGDVPAFTVVTLEGDTISAADLHGTVTVLNFWATWCGPCKLEMPSLQRMHEEYDDAVRVLGFSTDVGRLEVIEQVLAERSITYPVARVGEREKRVFGGVPMIPTTLIIDRDGVIRHRVEGLFLGPAMRIAVNRIVEEGRSPEADPERER